MRIHELKPVSLRNVIESAGPVSMKASESADVYSLINGVPAERSHGLIEAPRLTFNPIEEQLAAAERYRESIEREAERTYRRKRTQGIVKTGATVALSVWLVPQIGAALKSVSFFANNALALGAAKGAALGFMNSVIMEQNPLKGALRGAAFGCLGAGIEQGLGEVEFINQTKGLAERLSSLTTTVFASTVQGGDPVQSLAIALGVDTLAGKLVSSLPEQLQPIAQVMAQPMMAAFLKGGREEQLWSAIAEGVGSLAGSKLLEVQMDYLQERALIREKAASGSIREPKQASPTSHSVPSAPSSSAGAASQAGRSASSNGFERSPSRGGPSGRGGPPGGEPPRGPGGEPPRRGLLFEQEGAAPVVWHPATAPSKGQGLSGGRSKTSGLGGLLAAGVVPVAAKAAQASKTQASGLEPGDRHLFFSHSTPPRSAMSQKQSVERSTGGQGLSSPPVFLTAYGNYRDRSIGGFSAEPSFSPVMPGFGVAKNGRGLNSRVPLYDVDYPHSRYTPSSRPGVWGSGPWYGFGAAPERQQTQPRNETTFGEKILNFFFTPVEALPLLAPMAAGGLAGANGMEIGIYSTSLFNREANTNTNLILLC